MRAYAIALCFLLAVSACGSDHSAGLVTVAVAANFGTKAAEIIREFEQEGRGEITLVSGSTGKLFTQVVNGAPFDVYLSADEARAVALEEAGLGVPGTSFVYALGRLTLWGRDRQLVTTDGASVLRAGQFRRLAIANPATAPYGVAAQEALSALGLQDALESRIVMGENVAQAYAMVATGNAELGLLSLATVVSASGSAIGSRWDVPANLHAPIRQRAVLLQHGAKSHAAQEFLQYLRSPVALNIIRRSGYDTE
ncbi:MAG: molybdate ABC transporter substrate-binding protein [Pseudomonadales bacterium]|nr:molybdate ABC transporter substrate-binding protein [Pseudomonadales bacterium]